MKSATGSPSVATWLLERFTFGSGGESLIGDLLEEYRSGRSRAWYWRQALTAVVMSCAVELRDNGLLVLRAVTAGWAALYLGRFLFGSWPEMLSSPFDRRLPVAFDPLGHNGFIWWVFWIPVTLASGCAVGRFRRRPRLMVLAFSLSVLAWELRMLPWIFSLSADVLSNARYVPYLASNLAGLILPPASILLGGLCIAARENGSPGPRRPLTVSCRTQNQREV
jgi:hypothetical protein